MPEPPAPEAAVTPATSASDLDARDLDAGVFVDEAIFGWERRRLFDGGWVCVARSEELRDAGDQFAEAIGDTALLFLRAADGRLRAFVNVCRHQGTQLLPCGEAVNCDVVVCRGHAWVYGLDGTLLSAPASEDGGVEVDYAANSLQPVAAEERFGMVFAKVAAEDAEPDASKQVASLRRGAAGATQDHARDPDVRRGAPEGEDFGKHVGGLAALLEPLRLEQAIVAGWREYVVEANWKLILAAAMADHDGLRRLGRGAAAAACDDGTTLAYVFPNLVIRAGAGASASWLVVPKGAGETVVFCDWAFPPERFAEPDFDATPLVESADAANLAAWARAEGRQRDGAAAAAAIDPLLAEMLAERYEAPD